jgi:hypothetical protein
MKRQLYTNDMNNPLLISVATIFGLSILTTNISNNFAMAASKGGAFIVQEQVSTGNSNLDKEINKFYHCISKTHDDPPSIQSVDNCYYQTPIGYYQTSTGGISGGGNSNVQYNNGQTHSTNVGSLRVVPPPGVLVEVTQSP